MSVVRVSVLTESKSSSMYVLLLVLSISLIASIRADQLSQDEHHTHQSLLNPLSLLNISSLRSDTSELASIESEARSTSHQSVATNESSQAGLGAGSEWLDSIEASSKSQAAQTARQAIKSRYRVRANKVKFSQPLDVVASSEPRLDDKTHQSVARALPAGYSSGVIYSEPAVHLRASSQLAAPTQRISSTLELGHDEAGVASASSQPDLADYTPPVHQHQATHPSPASANQRLVQPTGAGLRLRTSQASQPLVSDLGAPYYAHTAAALGDYYESPADPHLSAGDLYDHYGPVANLSEIHSAAPYNSAPMLLPPVPLMPAPSSYYAGEHYLPASSGRSRWSWPWSDTSTGAPLSSASFKKHFFLHHQPTHVKEHDDHQHHYNDEHDHLMPKWEHGISIGEIACIAVAVVLGVIILGSPFFLLFLMLFNGGNLFGSTQMGLLAPASTQAAAAVPASGRRRRKRSIEKQSEQMKVIKGLTGDQLGKHLKDLGADGFGEYLFERLSPFLDAERLMQTFGKIMNIKDDFERIVEKLSQHGQDASFESAQVRTTGEKPTSDKSKHMHVEMRRKRRK